MQKNGNWCKLPGNITSLFRRKFDLTRPETAMFSVSADHRYRLYIDGKLLGAGPIRGDLEHYSFEEYEIGLDVGSHVIAVEVICFPEDEIPWAEVHSDGGFWCSGSVGDVSLSTQGDWRCVAGRYRKFRPWSEAWAKIKENDRIPAPPMEEFYFSHYPYNWECLEFDDSTWLAAKYKSAATIKNQCEMDPVSRLHLVSTELPQMQKNLVPTVSIIAGEGLRVDHGVLSGIIPAGKHRVLLDLGKYYTYMLDFEQRGGAGFGFLRYAERLVNDFGTAGTRHPYAEGKIGVFGMADKLIFDHASGRFQTFTYRSGRYVELEFELDSPLKITRLTMTECHFPLELKTTFAMPTRPDFERIFEVGWHTALCCAHEHYEDCPYWEQMQYVGDTRIQALISYAAAGEFRLGRRAIEHFDQSRLASGLTMSRYPVNFRQIIPQFSLFWIMMIGDYYRYTADKSIISNHVKGMRDVLDAFLQYQESETGLIGHIQGWNFADWTECWDSGRTARHEKSADALTNLVFGVACREAARLWQIVNWGDPQFYEAKAQQIFDAVEIFCYNPERQLYRDVPRREWYSQHTNAWAILSGIVSPKRTMAMADRILNDRELTGCTLYYQFYLIEAMRKIGHHSGIEQLLSNWQFLLDKGFTTFPETATEHTRSDCHAWSSAPVYEFVVYYAGVEPAKPGFSVVNVSPHGNDFVITAPVGEGKLITIERFGNALKLVANAPITVRLSVEQPLNVTASDNIILEVNTDATKKEYEATAINVVNASTL